MHIYLYIISAIAFILLFAALRRLTDKKRRLAAELEGRYRCTPLLTPTEAAFYPVLERIAHRHDYLLFCKVRLADVAKTARAEDYNTYMKYFGKVKSKHLDFILCSRSFIPLAVIELDDRSHENKRNRENDLLKDVVLESIDIPVIRVPVAENYDERRLERDISSAVDGA